MRITIIPDDSFIVVDGVSRPTTLDFSSCGIPNNVHALQWFDNRGWVEFNDLTDPFAPKPQNEEISALPVWAEAVYSVWQQWTPPAPIVQPEQAAQQV